MKIFSTTISKKLSIVALMMLSLCVVSCGDDDDDDNNDDGGGNPGAGVVSCYAKVDGEQTDFKYAYRYADYFEEENESEVELVFSTVDLLDYYYNPSKIQKGATYSELYLDFVAASDGKVIANTYNDYGMEFHRNLDLYDTALGDGNNYPANYMYYISEPPASMPTLTISKSGNTYRINLQSINFWASEHNGNIGSRQTVGSFYFEGSFEDVTTLLESAAYPDARCIAREVTDPGFIKWLKQIKKK